MSLSTAISMLTSSHARSSKAGWLISTCQPQWISCRHNSSSTLSTQSCSVVHPDTAQHSSPWNVDDQQLPGMAMLVMQQLQQSQRQLQQSLQTASWRQQQQKQPSLMPKPGSNQNSSSSSSVEFNTHIKQLSPSIRAPVDPVVTSQLRTAISSAISYQQLLQLLPAVAADVTVSSRSGLVVRLLLQAVRIQRSSSASSNSLDGNILYSEEQQQQQLQLLLYQCDNLLRQHYHHMMFQHVSGVLWSWAQLKWRPGAGAAIDDVNDDQLLRNVIDRLQECRIEHEKTGQVVGVGAQLARATTACASLGVTRQKMWRKLCDMITALAHTLTPAEVAACCWGLARNRYLPNTVKQKTFKALLVRAQQCLGYSVGGGSNSDDDVEFSRVGALNVVWAVSVADVADLAAPGLLDGLVRLILGQQYQTWQQQQQQQQAGMLGDSAAGTMYNIQQQQQYALADLSTVSHLLPHELSCLVWSLAAAARHDLKARNRWQRHGSSSRSGQYNRYQGQQQQEQPRRQNAHLHNDAVLVGYLVELVKGAVGSSDGAAAAAAGAHSSAAAAGSPAADRFLQPRQVANLTLAFTILLRQQQAQQQQQQQHMICQQIAHTIVSLWSFALNLTPASQLSGFKMRELSMLLRTISIAKQQQQLQQQQQHWPADTAAVSAALLTAAACCVLSADLAVVSSGTVVALMYQLIEVGYFDGAAKSLVAADAAASSLSSSSSVASASMVTHSEQRYRRTANVDQPERDGAAAATVLKKLLGELTSRNLSHLRVRELVMLAAAAGMLAAAAADEVSNTEPCSHSSSSTGNKLRMLLSKLLQQLSLPLAAVAHSLRLREMATAAAAYATAAVPAPHLFDAISQAVQQSQVLNYGSTWGLARVLSAYASLGYRDEQLFAAVVDALTPKLGRIQPRAMSRFIWALAESGYHDLGVMRAAAAVISQHAAAAQAVSSNVALGLGYNLQLEDAQADQEERLESAAGSSSGSSSGSNGSSASISSGSRCILPGYQPRDIAAIVWGFGSVGLRDPKHYQELAETALAQLTRFNISQLANLMWGLAAAGVYHAGLVAMVSASIANPGQASEVAAAAANLQQQQQGTATVVPLQGTAAAAGVSTLAWSLSELRCASPAVLQSCAVHFLGRTEQYSSADAADLAWAVVWSGWAVQQITVLQHQKTSSHDAGQVGAGVACSTSQQQLRPAAQQPGDVASLLQQLLSVAMSDLEQLTPQQLVNLTLVQAVTAAVAAATVTEDTASHASSSQWHHHHQQQQQGLLLSCVSGWGPRVFTAADGMKLLWAQLISGQPLQQQQQAVVIQKLLSAGARAAVHHTASVCSSRWCQEVVTAINNIDGLSARPTVTSKAVASASQAAAAAVGRAMAAITTSSRSEKTSKLTYTAVGCCGQPSHTFWDHLGPGVTQQLLGHVVVTVNSAAGGVSSDRSCSSSTPQEVLLCLVPKCELRRPAAEEVQVQGQTSGQNSSIAADPAVVEAVEDGAAVRAVAARCLTGGSSVVAGLLLQQQTCYRHTVIVTEAMWRDWGAARERSAVLQQIIKMACVDSGLHHTAG